MKRVVAHEFGGPEQLTVESAAQPPIPGPGELLIDLEAAGVNYLDVYQRKGLRKVPLPFTPGLERVGRVRQIGGGGSHAAGAIGVGRRVAWINVPGSYASQIIVPAAKAIVVPDSFTATQALLFQPLTAQYLVTEYRQMQAGDRVLVHSAAGGVGQLMVQWFKHLGAWVVGTASSDAKWAAIRAAGADAAINYGRDYQFLEELMSLTAGRGVDLAFDAIVAATLAATLKALARGGTAVSYGQSSGPAPAIEPRELTQRCLRLAGGSVFSYTAEATELRRRAAAVIEGIEAGWLRVGAAKEYKLEQAGEAHGALEARATQGKLYLYRAT
jgi:NADPH2:quinone reductase